MSVDRLLAAALSLRVTADTTGLEADLASKLTRAEKVATESATRTSAAVGKIADSTAAVGVKAEAATLRASAAQETYNRLLRAGETDTVRLARAQASALTAQATATRELTRASAPIGAAQATEAGTLGLLGGARGLVGLAAGAGAFTAVKQGVTAFNSLASSVRSYQRATGDTAESSSKMVALMQRFGIEGETASTAMLRLGRNIEQTPDKLTKYGVAIAHGKDGTTDLTQTLLNANEAWHQMPDAAARAALTLDLFGRGGQRLLPILSANRQQLEEIVAAAAKSGRILTPQQLADAYKFQQASYDIKEAWAGFEIVLAKGVVPALTDISHIGSDVLDFLGNHEVIAKTAERLGLLAGGLYAVNKAVKALDAVRGSTLFTRLLSVREIDAATAANYRLAESEVAVGRAAATGAAGAGAGATATVAAGAGAGFLARAGSGLLRSAGYVAGGYLVGQTLKDAIGGQAGSILAGAGTGAGTGAAIGQFVPVVGPVVGAGLGALVGGAHAVVGAENQASQDKLTKQAMSGSAGLAQVRQERARLAVEAGRVGGPAVSLLHQYDAAIAAATKQKAAQDAVNTALQNAATAAAIQQAAQAYSGSFDIFSAAPRIGSDPSKVAAARDAATHAKAEVGLDQQRLAALQSGRPASQASILAAETALAKARDHGSPLAISTAEARLNQLRTGGKATTLQLAAAEETLRVAKEKSAAASKAQHDAEKGGLVTASEVLANITGQRKYEQGNAVAVAQLTKLGLNSQTIASLVTQDKTTPGELKAFAKSASRSLVERINAEVKAENKASELIEAAAGSDADWQKVGRDRGAALLRGIQERIFLNTPNGGRPRTVQSGAAQTRRLRNLGTGFGVSLG